MQYAEACDFMFERLGAFHRVGAAAYKPGLETVTRLSAAFGSPHRSLRCIHVGGTNGKGSTAHTLAAILQAAGYNVGLFTSPHLLDYTERIRVNGQPMPHSAVVDFVERFRALDGRGGDPSFFELSTVMSFEWFARNRVDYAVIEVGLGGRLDSTNIITPLVSVITNISLDHTALLGKTKGAIAGEKAGIIKHGVPVVIGESDEETAPVFIAKAAEEKAPITFADKTGQILSPRLTDSGIEYATRDFGTFTAQLSGIGQEQNTATILEAVTRLRAQGVELPLEAVHRGFARVCDMTGLMGRWMRVADSPLTICDTGHNPGAWQYLGPRLQTLPAPLHIVLGFVSDKDITTIMEYMPRQAHYYFVQPSTPRAAAAEAVAVKAAAHGLQGEVCGTVANGYEKALANAVADRGSVYVGGSTFVVADLLELLSHKVD